jgi:Putative peptidoglycan binding domain
MPDSYIVEQGDHLSKIAKEHGFPDYRVIWDHPDNADLKKLRQNPNVLLPGDEVVIPDKEERIESGGTEKRHTFEVKTSTLKLRLVLEDIYEKPIAGAACALVVGIDTFQLTTDGNGKLEHDIPLDATDATLVIRGDQTPFADNPFPVKIGSLDPVDEISGQVARLNNLGYFPGDGNDSDAFQSAVEEFQCDHSLTVDGICGPNTQAKLEKVHGC